jgi:hypothetical protein
MNRLALAHQHGFNMIHPVPGGASYADSEGRTRFIEAYLDEASRLGIRVMYDMRHGKQSRLDLRPIDRRDSPTYADRGQGSRTLLRSASRLHVSAITQLCLCGISPTSLMGHRHLSTR